MDWLTTKLVTCAAGAVVSLLSAFYWYDKKTRDNRLDKLESRMTEAESDHNNVLTELAVVKSDIKHGYEMSQLQLQHVNDSLAEITALVKEVHNAQHTN